MMLFNHLIFCCPLLLLPSIFPSIRGFCHKLALQIRWPKYYSFSISSNEHSGLIHWFDLLEVWGTQAPSPTPQFENINSSALSLLYGPTLTSIHDYWKKITALTIETFGGKEMSLLSNMLSRFVIVFLPRSKHLLISWPQSPSTVILEPKKVKW